MKRRIFLTILALSFLLATSLFPALLTRGTIVEVERDYTVMELPNSTGGGFEPHILAGPSIAGEEWLYVDSPTGLGNTQGGNLWISKDHGDTWDWFDKDSVFGTSGDSYTVISEEGNIYYTDLYLSSASVDSSLDGGETWIANPFASVYTIVDRQWLQIGPNSGGGENIYFSFNQLAVGLVMVKAELTGLTGVALDWKPCNFGLPITSDVGSRDNMIVDHNNGNIYHANYGSGSGVMCYVSTNEGNSFSGYQVHDETVHAKVQNTFIDMDVDEAGNVYMMWSSRDHIMLGISTDEGQTWDVKEVTEAEGCRVFPWIAGGDEGRIAMAWYDTPTPGNPNNLDEAWWDFVVATSVNALDEDPIFELTVVDPNAHYGSVRTSGLDGDDGPAPDRDLGDYIGVDIDQYGRVIVAYGKDGDDGTNNRQIPCLFGRQNEGPFLIDEVGPQADFTVKTNDLSVKVDASTSFDWNDMELGNYSWNWGDNSSGEGMEATHDYAEAGSYEIILIVTNEDGLMSSMSMGVTVEEKDETSYIHIYASTIALFLVILGAWLYSKKKDEKIPDAVAPAMAREEKVQDAAPAEAKEMDYGKEGSEEKPGVGERTAGSGEEDGPPPEAG